MTGARPGSQRRGRGNDAKCARCGPPSAVAASPPFMNATLGSGLAMMRLRDRTTSPRVRSASVGGACAPRRRRVRRLGTGCGPGHSGRRDAADDLLPGLVRPDQHDDPPGDAALVRLPRRMGVLVVGDVGRSLPAGNPRRRRGQLPQDLHLGQRPRHLEAHDRRAERHLHAQDRPGDGRLSELWTSYNAAQGKVRIAGLETPVFRYGKFVGSNDPMCGGGPEIDVFGAPAHWDPRGDGGAVLSMSTGGVHHYDRDWKWGHSFGGGLSRSYLSAMRSTLQVSFSR